SGRAALASPPPLAGEGQGGGTFDGSCNRFQNALPVDHDVIIVEAQNTKAFVGKISISAGVAVLLFLFEVVSPIDLDNEPCGVADEIHDVGADRCLATETRAVQAMSTQCRPYDSLGIGRIRSQRSRPDALLRRHVPTRCFCTLSHHGSCFSCPLPNPPPQAGEGAYRVRARSCSIPFANTRANLSRHQARTRSSTPARSPAAPIGADISPAPSP